MKKFQLDSSPKKATRSKHAILAYMLEGTKFFVEGVPIDPSEFPSVRRMRECMSQYYISLALVKNSPYTKVFSEVLHRLIESGIVHFWKQSIVSERTPPSMGSVFSSDDKLAAQPKVLAFKNVQGAFFIWGIGMFVALTVFCVEYLKT